jgi:hypothetical protein
MKVLHESHQQQTASLDRSSAQYLDARTEIQTLERELTDLNRLTRSMYVNYKLMGEDIGWITMKALDNGIERYRDLQQFLSHTFPEAGEAIRNSLAGGNQLYQHHVQNRMNGWAAQLKTVDAVEGVRLTLVSMVESASTVVLNYVELTQEAEEGGKKTTKFLNAKKRRTKTRAKLDKSFLMWLKKAQKDPERVVSSGLAMSAMLFILLLVYKIFKFLISLVGRGRKVKRD